MKLPRRHPVPRPGAAPQAGPKTSKGPRRAPRRPPIRPRPRVIVNMAMTADGKIATANRELSSFGSRADHRNLYRLRGRADAIICGAATAAAPGVLLDAGGPARERARVRAGLAPRPIRIIVSGRARLTQGASVFEEVGAPLLILVSADAPRARVRRLRPVADAVRAFGRRELDVTAALGWLRREWRVRTLLLEGGGALNDAFFRAGVVDELHLTICPWLAGGENAPTIAEGLGVARLAQGTRLKLARRRRVGSELFLVYARRARLRPGGGATPRPG